jgi:hypothetical protein
LELRPGDWFLVNMDEFSKQSTTGKKEDIKNCTLHDYIYRYQNYSNTKQIIKPGVGVGIEDRGEERNFWGMMTVFPSLIVVMAACMYLFPKI